MRLAITPAKMERRNVTILTDTPPSIAMSRGGNASSIAYFAAKMNPQRTASLTDEEIEAELADYRAELLAEREARSASEDGNAKRA